MPRLKPFAFGILCVTSKVRAEGRGPYRLGRLGRGEVRGQPDSGLVRTESGQPRPAS